jgi:hypothetical protein
VAKGLAAAAEYTRTDRTGRNPSAGNKWTRATALWRGVNLSRTDSYRFVQCVWARRIRFRPAVNLRASSSFPVVGVVAIFGDRFLPPSRDGRTSVDIVSVLNSESINDISQTLQHYSGWQITSCQAYYMLENLDSMRKTWRCRPPAVACRPDER